MIDNFENSIKESLCGSLDLIPENIIDTDIGAIFGEGNPLKSIPIVGVLIETAKIGLAANDYFFAKKVVSFLNGVKTSGISVEQRTDVINKIEYDNKYKSKFGETIINLINKAQDSENAKYIGDLFSLVFAKKISYDEGIYCANIIVNTPNGCLRDFVLSSAIEDVPESSKDIIIFSGLLSIGVSKINATVKDRDQIEAEKQVGNPGQSFMSGLASSVYDFELNPAISIARNLFGSTENNDKYRVTTEGGKIVYEISKYGLMIKDALSEEFKTNS